VPAFRVEWHTNWRNKLGQTEIRLLTAASLTRSVFEKIVWKNPQPSEQADLLTREQPDPGEWIAWPMPSDPPEPEPEDQGESRPSSDPGEATLLSRIASSEGLGSAGLREAQ
jgi:hypothetical protein